MAISAAVNSDPNRLARRNALILSAAQALNGSAAPISIALGGLAGMYLLGADKSWATVPVTSYNLGVALTALPAAMLMRKIGRRLGFMSGSVVGMCGSLISAYALYIGSFYLFCFGMVFSGAGGAFTQQFRFAAADEGEDSFKPKAISWVLAGGILAAVIGPQTASHFKDLFAPVQFAGAYFAGTFILFAGMLVLSQLKFTEPLQRDTVVDDTNTRPLAEIVMQPQFIVALMCAIGAYALMSFVMTAAPLAMVACGISQENAILGIQWHVLAMFGPSFFTGNLIARFGKKTIVATGFFLLIACAIVAIQGQELWQFWVSLVLLGIGWNFGFIGATAMLTDTYTPAERNKTQGINDFLLFGSVAFASMMSGQTLNAFGWTMLNWVAFPVVAICLIGLTWLHLKSQKTA